MTRRMISINNMFPVAQSHLQHLMQTLTPIITDTTNKYPPHNLYHSGESEVTIELAVAGFEKSEITITAENGVLSVVGQKATDDDKTYLYKGIATRPFSFRTSMIEGSKIVSAKMVDGILRIVVESPKPEVKKPSTINID